MYIIDFNMIFYYSAAQAGYPFIYVIKKSLNKETSYKDSCILVRFYIFQVLFNCLRILQ